MFEWIEVYRGISGKLLRAPKDLFLLWIHRLRETTNGEPLNWIDTKFLIEPQPCSSNTRAVFVVHSKAEHFEQRTFLRKEYFSKHSQRVREQQEIKLNAFLGSQDYLRRSQECLPQ
jgi:hypothetical protein